MSRPLAVVTGASGFVGRHLVGDLICGGWNVRAVVRDLAGSERVSRAISIRTLGGESFSLDGNVDYQLVPDIERFTYWPTILAGVEVVVHLAAVVHKSGSEAPTASEYNRVNVQGTLKLAQECFRVGVKRLIFVSSVKAVGESSVNGPYTEESKAAPNDSYGRSKLAAEEALLQFGKESGLEVVILRPPLVYGPGVGANFLRLLRFAAFMSPLVFPMTSAKRSLISVRNLCSAIQCCMRHERAANQVFFVADSEDITTGELVRKLAVSLGNRPLAIRFPEWFFAIALRFAGRGEESRRIFGALQVSNEKIRKWLDWSPPESVDSALELVVRSYQDQRGAGRS